MTRPYVPISESEYRKKVEELRNTRLRRLNDWMERGLNRCADFMFGEWAGLSLLVLISFIVLVVSLGLYFGGE